jgi:hypothetical protein
MNTRVSICTHGDPENGQPFCLRPDIKGIEGRGDQWDPTASSGWRKRTERGRKREREVVSLVEDSEEEEGSDEAQVFQRSDDGFFYDQDGDRIYG